MKPEELLKAAQQARTKSYAPYSNFRVGAALLTCDGRVFLGGNIESASYGATICAERAAVASAVSSGARSFCAIAIVGGPAEKESSVPCPPCGICLQVLSEFCGPDFPIYLQGGEGKVKTYFLKELLPVAFGESSLGGKKE